MHSIFSTSIFQLVNDYGEWNKINPVLQMLMSTTKLLDDVWLLRLVR
jgi:hypothetical protein